MSDSSSAYERVVQGVTVVLIGNVVGMLFSFLTRLVPATLLPPGDYGLIALAGTVILVGGMIGRLGFEVGLARELPRSSSPSTTFFSGFVLTFGTSVALGLLVGWLAGPIALLFDDPALEPFFVACAFGIPSMAVIKIVASGFRGTEDMVGRLLVDNVVHRVGVFVVVVAAIVQGYGAFGATVGWVGALCLTALFGIALVARRTALFTAPVKRALSPRELRKLLVFSLPLVGANAAWFLIRQLDNLFVRYYIDSAALGTYDAAFTLTQLVFVFFWPVRVLMLPVVSDIATTDQWETIREVYRLTTKWVVLFTLPLVVLLFRFPGEILSVVFGPAYSTGQLALSILTVGFLTHVVVGPNRETLIALGHSRLVFGATTLALVANVVCNAVLIPPAGTAGAALASMISYTGLNVVLTVILIRRYQITPVSPALPWSCAVGVLGLGTVLTGIRYVIPAVEFALVGSTIAVALSYPVLLLIGFEPADARLVRQFESSIPVDTDRLIAWLSRLD